jgi:hypothetical protein
MESRESFSFELILSSSPLDYSSELGLVRIVRTVYGFLRYRDDIFMLQDIKGSMALYFGNLKSKIRI